MTRQRFLALNLAAIVVLLATGCNKSAPTTAWTLALKISPDHPRMVRPATFILHIADSQGAPVDGAQVTASLNMALMNMGKTEMKFEPKGNGNYEATLKSFDMSGPWELTVDATQGTLHVNKDFQFDVFD